MLSKTKKVFTTHLTVLCSIASYKLFYRITWRVETLSLLFVPPTERRRNGDYYATKSLAEILGEATLVDRITAGYVREQLAARSEKPGTTNERITRLKALFRWGYENDYIKDIRWLDKLKKFKDEEKQQKLEDKYLESEELKILLDNISVEK